ncbi:dNTP triphosphohydrolase [Nitratireductor mangrovi]|uniref:DNTP triphosphohydrolase n=1 Tax=Nitratireductor mangrovi TaxID=2599600 RepID=A0A5B8KW63_9HYPH|nr:dNTP triphosphohydrolase [Nitratireductor mangrovi]QDY99778.1 dNTP triphosphohydrolase [Nitratireductor mangrovi]
MGDLYNNKRFSEGERVEKTDDSTRNEFERDFDRILFSAPVRRLADKTQVFPLEKNDSVRTRLTHSHEVANLCRSLATQILRERKCAFGNAPNTEFAPTIAASVGLAHDLGNPPFGHQGETSISRWFVERFDGEGWGVPLTEQMRTDFEHWEGNAQAFRLLTRLQVSKGSHGLDLTFATLAALMKYTVGSEKRGKEEHPAFKKFGYFDADRKNAERVLSEVGLAPGQRHPIAYLMEACDDIAYSVIDIEDAVKKQLISINDIIAALRRINNGHYEDLATAIEIRVSELQSEKRSVSEVNDIGAQYYRTFVIQTMVVATSKTFLAHSDAIISGNFKQSLIKASEASDLCKALKSLASDHAYNAPAVKEIELRGDNLLRSLLSYFWRSIEECSPLPSELDGNDRAALAPRTSTPFGEFVFSHISQNYVRCYESDTAGMGDAAGVRYRQMLLLTDMVSGMTENFAIDLEAKFRQLDDGRYDYH